MRAASLCFLVGLWAIDLAGCDGDSYRLGGLAESQEGSGGAAAEGGAAVGTGGGSDGAGGSSAGSSGSGGAAGSLPDAGAGGAFVGGAAGFFPVGGAAGSATGGAAGGPALTQDVVKILDSSEGVAAVEADEEYVYFNSWGGDVLRLDHSGLGLRQLAETVSYFMISDEAYLYWTTSSDIRRVPKAGGATEVVMTLKAPNTESVVALELAVDATYVYASTYEGGTVVRAPKTGGTPEILARADGMMGGIAVAENALFWAEYDYHGNVHRTELESGATSLFLPNGSGKMRVVGDDLWIPPVTDEKLIIRAPLAGGVNKRYPFGDYLTSLSSDGLHVYWRWDALMRINLVTDAVEKVADIDAGPAGLAVTQHFIFVGGEGAPNGVIYRISKPLP